jgi:hypothetical protein
MLADKVRQSDQTSFKTCQNLGLACRPADPQIKGEQSLRRRG